MFTWVVVLSIASILLVVILGVAEKQGKLAAKTSGIAMILLGLVWSIVGLFMPTLSKPIQNGTITIYLNGLGVLLFIVGVWRLFQNYARKRA